MVQAIAIHASSETDANLYYATRFLVGDPVSFVQVGRRKILALHDLELGRGHDQAEVDEVFAVSSLRDRTPAAVIAHLLKRAGARRVEVPENFPLAVADRLRATGLRVAPRPDPFFPQRQVKSKDEVAAIVRVQRATEEAVERAIDVLRRSRVSGAKLRHRGALVTSEFLRGVIHRALMERGCIGKNTIVAGGDQACDPHNRGSGPIPAGLPIVFDVFPRAADSFYFADMSRTVLKGRASTAQRRLFEAVREGQEIGIDAVRAGVNGRAVDATIRAHFKKLGYVTERRGDKMVGYFHGTGHGVGLDIHEAPWLLGRMDSTLPAGSVVTVEPGLYYPGVGGVRLEDMVLVTRTGGRNLTRFPKTLEV